MLIQITKQKLDYQPTIDEMEQYVKSIIEQNAEDKLWLLEHNPVYTAGTSSNDADILTNEFPVFKTGRGGKHTYHGPGQRIAYIMADLKKHNLNDLKQYVCNVEEWVIQSLAEVGVQSFRRAGRVGIWVFDQNNIEKKIAAIGIRVRKWVSFHGVAININPNLAHFNGIVPCGIAEFGVTSLHDLGVKISMEEFDEILIAKRQIIFEGKNFCEK